MDKRETTDVAIEAINSRSEIPNNSDTISRQAVIDALKKDMASLDHIIKGMSANDVRLDAYVSQRNQVNYDINTINNFPPAQPEQLGTDLAEVGTDCISRQAATDALRKMQTYKMFSGDDMLLIDQAGAMTELMMLPPAQPKRGKWIKKHRHYGGFRSYTGFDAMGEQHTVAVDERTEYDDLYCSECGARSADNFLNFCPNCGADMREVTT